MCFFRNENRIEIKAFQTVKVTTSLNGAEQKKRQNAPDRSRTYNLRFRRPLLYPIELRALTNLLSCKCDNFQIELPFSGKIT